MTVLTAGLRFAPRDFRMLFNRGYMQYKLARYEKAISDFHGCWAICSASPVSAPKNTPFAASSASRSAASSLTSSDSGAAATAAPKRGMSEQQNTWRRMGSCVVQWNMALW